MTEWASLRDTYGSAEQVPAFLAAAAAAETETDEAWANLWTRLYHQGGVCSASYAALPALAQMSRERGPRGYLAALHLAAAIVASVDGPEDPAAVRQRYANELAALHAVAVRNLRYATSDMEFVYVLEALMAFENGGVWQRNLHWLASGEAEIDCPSCGEHLVLDLEGPDFLMASFTDPFLAPTTVAPVEHAEATMENRLLVLSQAHGRPAVAGKLPRLSGAQPAHAAERRSTYPKRSSETGITCKRKHSSSDGKPTRHLPRSVRRRNGCRGVAGDRRRIQLSCSDSGARAIQRSASKGNWSKTSPLPDPRRRSTRPITYRRHRREVGHDR